MQNTQVAEGKTLGQWVTGWSQAQKGKFEANRTEREAADSVMENEALDRSEATLRTQVLGGDDELCG